MKEKLMQDLIINFPSEILDEPGLSYLQREVKTGNNRLDIVLLDRRGRHLLVEVQLGSLDTKHIDRHIDYSEGYLADHATADIRILYIANHIDIHRKNFLQRRGYEYKEISEAKLREVALEHGFTLDAEVLLQEKSSRKSVVRNEIPKLIISTQKGSFQPDSLTPPARKDRACGSTALPLAGARNS